MARNGVVPTPRHSTLSKLKVFCKANNKKQENDLDSKIRVSIYDLKDKEKTYEETVKHLKLVNVKFNKKIKVFLHY